MGINMDAVNAYKNKQTANGSPINMDAIAEYKRTGKNPIEDQGSGVAPTAPVQVSRVAAEQKPHLVFRPDGTVDAYETMKTYGYTGTEQQWQTTLENGRKQATEQKNEPVQSRVTPAHTANVEPFHKIVARSEGDIAQGIGGDDIGSKANQLARTDRTQGTMLEQALGAGVVTGARNAANEASYLQQAYQKSAQLQGANAMAGAAAFNPNNQYLQKAALLQAEDAMRANNAPMETRFNFGREFTDSVEGRINDSTGIQKLVYQTANAIGGMVPSIALSVIPGVGQVLSLGTMGMNAAGGATEDALKAGVDNGNALMYGAAVGIVEVLTEKMFDGVAGVFGKGGADDFVIGQIKKRLAGDVAAQRALVTLFGMLGEGAEEFVAEYADWGLNKLLVGNDDRNFKDVSVDALYSALIGGVVGGVMQGAGSIANGQSISAKRLAEHTVNQLNDAVTDAKVGTAKAKSELTKAEQSNGMMSAEAAAARSALTKAQETERSASAELEANRLGYNSAEEMRTAESQRRQAIADLETAVLQNEARYGGKAAAGDIAKNQALLDRLGINPNGKSNTELRKEINAKLHELNLTQNNGTMNASNGQEVDYGRRESLGGEGRTGSLAAQEQSTGVAEYSEEGNQRENGAENSGQNYVDGVTLGIESAVSAAEDTTKTLREVKTYNESQKKMIADAAKKGQNLRFFTGDLWVKDGKNGKPYKVRGLISADGKNIWVKTDHSTYSAEQIYKHEDYHAEIKKNKNVLNEGVKALKNKYSKRELRNIIKWYAETYNMEDLGLSDEYIIEEILCDAYAGIDLKRYAGFGKMVDVDASDVANNALKAKQGEERTGTDAKASRNEEERRRSLRPGEMVNKFSGSVNWPEYYRKISSPEYNPDKYEDGEKKLLYMSNGDVLVLEMQTNGEFSVKDIKRGRRNYGKNLERNRRGNGEQRTVSGDSRNSGGDFGFGRRIGRDQTGERTERNSNEGKNSERSNREDTAVSDEFIRNNGAEIIDGSVTKASRETWDKTDKDKMLDDLVKLGYPKRKAQKWIKDVSSVAAIIADDANRLDYISSEVHKMLKKNQEYFYTLDASTLCAKRLLYQGTFDKISHELQNIYLTSDDMLQVRKMMNDKGYEVPCGICYVESRRRHLGKFADEWLKNYKGEYIPTLDEVTTTDGLENLRKTHKQTYNDFIASMNKKGSGNPKVVELRAAYSEEDGIMNLTKTEIDKIVRIGGMRIQSFSDFETPHLIDTMQAVMDMARRKLTSQAYTKVPNFAWVFGNTGIKINLSLIGDVDENGNLTFDNKEGMNFDEAMKVRNAYSKNVGTILVGRSDAHIRAAMKAKYIDYIIPFHRSGWGQGEYEALGLNGYSDYTALQMEADLGYGKIDQLYPIDYWDYDVSGNKNARIYLEKCMETGRLPKFLNFAFGEKTARGFIAEHPEYNLTVDDLLTVEGMSGLYRAQAQKRDVAQAYFEYALENGKIENGYWKMLIDFKMYDNSGKGAPQQTVEPNFNMDEANRVLKEYEGGADTLPVADDIVEEFVKQKKEQVGEESGAKPKSEVKASRDEDNAFLEKSTKKYGNVEQSAIEHFGTTKDFRTAGYILKDGTMLDFSGAHWLEGQSEAYIADWRKKNDIRQVDHEDIFEAFELSADDFPSDSRKEFINRGNIRMSPEAPGINIASEPTAEQYDVIRELIKRNPYGADGFYVDIEDKKKRVDKLTYSGNVNADRVINDIKHFYETGTVREQSSVAMFHSMYSREASEDYSALVKENRRLKKQVEKLQSMTKETKGWKADMAEEEKTTNAILKNVHSKADATEMRKRITALHEDLSNGKLTYEQGKDIASDIASDIIARSEMLMSKDMESYKKLQRIMKDGSSTESRYAKMQAELGKDMMPDLSTVEEKWSQMKEVMETLKPFVANPYELEKAMIIDSVADDIINAGMEIHAARMNAVDKALAKAEANKAEGARALDAQKQLDAMYYGRLLAEEKARSKAALEKERESSDKKLAAQKKETRSALDMVNVEKEVGKYLVEQQRFVDDMFYNRKIAELRKNRDEKIEKIKQHQIEVNTAKREMKKERADREKLRRIVKRLQSKKIDPVTKSMIPSIVAELDATSVNITDKSINDLTELRQWYTDKTTEGTDIYDPDFIPDKATLKKLERLEKAMKGKTIGQMTISDVRDLTEVLQNIEHNMHEAKKFQNSQLKKDNYEAGLAVMEDVKNAVKGKINRELSPLRAARRIAGYNDGTIDGTTESPLITLMKEMIEGERKADIYQREAIHRLEKWLNDGKFMRSIYGKNANEISITGFDAETGEEKTVLITPAMQMSLYLHSLNDDNMRHIQNGGVTIPDMKLYKQGKISEAYDNSVILKISKTKVAGIAERMSAQERAFAMAIHGYFNGFAPVRLNAASVMIDGYEKFNLEDYFPISVDKDFIGHDYEAIVMNDDGSLSHPGFGEERIQSKRPIYLRDINDVFMKAVQVNSKYACQAVPLMNMNKLLNIKKAQTSNTETVGALSREITKKFGESGMLYMKKFMSDYAGNRGGNNSRIDKMLAKMRSNYAGGVLTLAGGTAIKQAASYPTAAAVLSAKSLAQAMNPVNQVDVSFIDKRTAAFTKRTEGLSTVELAELTQEGKKIPKYLNWIQGVDVGTTMLLKRAAAMEIKNTTQLMEGTEAYEKAVTDLYIKTIEETQPNYSTALRPDILRSNSALERSLVMFATQPMQNFNILYDSINDYRCKKTAYLNNKNAATEKALKSTQKKMAKAIGSQTVSALVFALMQAAYDWFRKKDDKYRDEDGEYTLLSFSKAIGLNMLSTGAGMFVGGKVALEFAQVITDKIVKGFGGEAVFGTNIYGFEVAELAAITDATTSIVNAVGELSKAVNNAFDPDKDVNVESAVRKVLTAVEDTAILFGIPLKNAETMISGVVKNILIPALGKDLGGYYAIRISSDPSSRKSEFYDHLWSAYKSGSKDLRKLYNTMLQDGFTEDGIKSAMEDRMKKDQGVKSVNDLKKRWRAP